MWFRNFFGDVVPFRPARNASLYVRDTVNGADELVEVVFVEGKGHHVLQAAHLGRSGAARAGHNQSAIADVASDLADLIVLFFV